MTLMQLAVGVAAVCLRSGKFSDEVLRAAGVVEVYDRVAALLEAYDRSPLAAIHGA